MLGRARTWCNDSKRAVCGCLCTKSGRWIESVCQDMLEQGLPTSIGCSQIILKFQAIKSIRILFKI